jgi:hypothetical protein
MRPWFIDAKGRHRDLLLAPRPCSAVSALEQVTRVGDEEGGSMDREVELRVSHDDRRTWKRVPR